MRPPKKIQVGAISFAVDYDPTLQDEGDVGRMIGVAQQIRLAPGQAPDYERDTVLHEVIHAAILNTNLRKMSGWDGPMEEAIILALAPQLLQVVRDNPKLLAYLVERS